MRGTRMWRDVLLDRVRVRGPVHARERNDESVIQLRELRTLRAHDIAHLATVLPGQHHAHVTRVAEASDALEEFRLRKVLGKGEQRGTDRGGEVNLLSKADPGIILNDTDRLVHASGEVDRLPIEQVGAEVVDRGDPVLDSLWKGNVSGGFSATLTGLTTPFIGTKALNQTPGLISWTREMNSEPSARAYIG